MEDSRKSGVLKSIPSILDVVVSAKDTSLDIQVGAVANYDKVEKKDVVGFQEREVAGDHNVGEPTHDVMLRWVGDIPLHIVYEIARLLHPGAVANVRCVAMEWNRELTSKKFIKHHLESQIVLGNISYIYSKSSCLFFSSFDGEYAHEIEFVEEGLLEKGKRVIIEASCHGLVLVNVGCDERSKLLVNPITNMRQLVSHDSLGKYAYETNTETDSEHESGPILQCVWGLGFNEGNQDDVVVKIEYEDGHPESTSTAVYSFNDHTWYNIASLGYYHDIDEVHDPSGKYLGGILYWLAEKDVVGEESPFVVAKLCLATRAFEEAIPLPKDLNDEPFGGVVVLGENFGVWSENGVWTYDGKFWNDVQVDTRGKIILQAVGLYGKEELVLELEEVENDIRKRHLWLFNLISKTLRSIGDDYDLPYGNVFTFTPSFSHPSRI